MIFKSKYCFSGVLGYPGLALVGELGSDGDMLPWFLLIMFLHLPFAIWLSLVFACVAVSDSGLAVTLYLCSWETSSFCVHGYIGTL